MDYIKNAFRMIFHFFTTYYIRITMAIHLRDYKTAKERRDAIEKELHVSLPNISRFSFDEQQVSDKNCENMLGGISVPVGIAGPVRIKDEGSRIKDYYIPL